MVSQGSLTKSGVLHPFCLSVLFEEDYYIDYSLHWLSWGGVLHAKYVVVVAGCRKSPIVVA